MVNKKKVCIITPTHWSKGMGGSEYQVKLLVKELLLHQEAHLVYLSRRVKKGYRPSQYDLFKISRENIFQRYGFFFDTLSLLTLLKKIRPDIIYQRVGCAYTGIAAYYAKKAGCKMIWHISGDRGLSLEPKRVGLKPNRYIEKKVFEWGIKNAQVIIAQSEYQEKLVEKINPTASIHLIRNFHPLPEESTETAELDQIVWIANLKRLKQPEMYIELGEELKKNKIKTKLIMIGAPAAYPNGYQRDIEDRLENSDNIKYMGKLSQEKVNEIITQSKLLINTSKWEGFPNTFIQAWMRKTPVVSLHCDPDHIISNYGCGLVSGSFQKMVADVISLLNSEQQREKMGADAQKFAFENLSLKNLEKLRNIFSENF